MGSKPDLKYRIAAIAAAILLSTAAYFWSSGLHPVWWLIWFAPLPILLLAPRVKAWITVIAAFAARAIGALDMWQYLYQRLHFSLSFVLMSVLEPAAVFTIAVLLYRSFFCRGERWRAVLTFPAVIVAAEYLFSLSQGTFFSIAYTQLTDLPILQLGALTGLWGISFTVMLFPVMLAAAFLSQGAVRSRMAIVLTIFLVCVTAYGAWRLHATPNTSQSVMVGLADSDLPRNTFPQDPQPTMALMRGYAEQVQKLAAQGAKFIVLPEMTAVVPDTISGQIDALFQDAAHRAGAQVLLGILHVTAGAAYNEARLYSASGEIETVYRKHHLVPGFEARTTPGNDISILPQPVGTIGVQICRDMDYTDLARRYGGKDVGLLLVPAWDFDIDRSWHGHMALMRGVENGFSIVRTAKQGLLTVSDDRGRILSEARTTPSSDFTTLVTTVPVRHDTTFYQKWGDWFAWLDLAGIVALLVLLVKRSPKVLPPSFS